MDDSVPSISRREFATLSAATVGSLLASGAGRATSLSSDTTTDRYEFLLDHVEESYEIPTVATLDSESGVAVFDSLSLDYRTHTDGTPAVYARLVPDDAVTVAESDGVHRLEYSPGANPFWKLDVYDDGVFPDPTDSVGYIGTEEALAGFDSLETAHPDRVRVRHVGESPGHENRYEGGVDPRTVWAVELTDDVRDEAAVSDKEKIVFCASIHGDERAGVEAGLRFVEDVLAGEEETVANLLSEYVVVVVCPNPDGWVVRERVFENPTRTPDFRRFNARDRDLNRQFPVTGWIDPDNVPAEPRGSNLTSDHDGAVDDDVPDRVTEDVPDALAVVEFLRSYDDVAYVVDLHGMYGHTNAVVGIGTGGGTPEERADELLLQRRIGDELEDSVGSVEDWKTAFDASVEMTERQIGCPSEFFCQTPERIFGYGTAADTIGYTGTGFFDSWAGGSREQGGLDATVLTLEIVFSNSTTEEMANRHEPQTTAFHVAAYAAACRATVEHARTEVEATIRSGSRSTAYLHTDSLTRRASDLSHFDGEKAPKRRGASNGSTLETARHRLTADPEGRLDVEVTPSVHTLSIDVRPDDAGPLEVTLRDGEGATFRDGGGTSPVVTDRTRPGTTFSLLDPSPGTWTVETRASGRATDLRVRTTRLDAVADPDPEEVLGYEQRNYEVTPLAAFEALAEATDAPVDAVAGTALAEGTLLEDGNPVYDNLVVTHADVDTAAIDAIGAFVEAGGNLVVTDAGLELLADLDVAGFDGVTEDHISRLDTRFAEYGEEYPDHPLFLDRIEFGEESWIAQREPWHHPPVGYPRNGVPTHTVDLKPLEAVDPMVAFEDVEDARVATVPTTDGRTGVHLLGSLLPPAGQEVLHPFGVTDHALTLFGYQVLCNALGYQLQCFSDGEPAVTFGEALDPVQRPASTPTPDGTVTPAQTPSATPSGTRDDSRTPTTSEPSTPTPDADDDGVGFGVLTGLAGLGGAGYFLSRDATDDGGDEGRYTGRRND